MTINRKASKSVVVSCFFPTPAQLKVELSKPAVQQTLNAEMLRQQAIISQYYDGCE